MTKLKKLWLSVAVLICAALGVFAACTNGGPKLTFEMNGAPAMEAVELEKGQTYELPTPEWTGHAFEGWYLDGAFTGEAVTSVTGEKSVKVYAKWTQLSAIELQLGGGSLAEGTTLYLRAGENLFAFMQDYIPTKANSEFGEWLLNGESLAHSAVMPEAGVTLVAHYKTAYTVELYEQNLSQDGYVKVQEPLTGYAYAGEEYTPEPGVHGFYVDEGHEGSLSTKVISEDPAQNVFTLYLNRLSYQVQFMDSRFGGATVSGNYVYGTEIELPEDLFTAGEGYLFGGWSNTSGGELAYPIAPEVFNADEEREPVTVTVEDDLLFYAGWLRGYTDKFGTEDLLFLPDASSDIIYLLRAGLLFEGEYLPNGMEFYFSGLTGQIAIEGRLFTDGSFAFKNDSRSEFSRKLFKAGRVDENTVIYFDKYNGITYSTKVTGGTQTDDSEGTYDFDENGFLLATFTTGSLTGQTLTIMTRTATVNGDNISVFLVRNEEEFSWGEMQRNAINNGQLSYYPEAYLLTLDGFFTATIRMGSGANATTSTYTYTREGDDITLVSNSYLPTVYRHIVMQNGVHRYAVYDADLDHEYTDGEGGKLVLDGTYNATYTDKSGRSVTGYYTVGFSVLGDLVTFTGGNATRKFIVKEEDLSVEDGAAQVAYTFAEKPEGYSEYLYCEGENAYYAPLVVFDDDASTVGKITIYGYVGETQTYEKAVVGTYESEGPFYVMTVTQHFELSEGVSTAFCDYATLKTVVFCTDIFLAQSSFGTSAYVVNFWYAVASDEDAEPVPKYSAQYKEAGEGSGTLTIIAPFAIYVPSEGETVVGQYSTSGSILVLQPYTSSSSYYFELDAENGTFLYLDDMLGTLYKYDVTTGSRVTTERLVFDGKGGVTYYYTEAAESGNVEKSAEGTYEILEEVSLGRSRIVAFHANEGDLTIEFLVVELSSYVLYFPRTGISGKFECETATGVEDLELDGFGYYATYTDEEGYTYAGPYTLEGENAVLLSIGNGYAIYFDVDPTKKTFTLRGGEYGMYFVMDNNGLTDLVFSFDGYGGLSVVRIGDDGEETVVDENGEYEITGGVFALRYTDGAEEVELTGARGTVTVSGTRLPVFFIEHKEVMYTYVSTDLSLVLVLDAYGGAVLHLSDGTTEQARYYLITENLMYCDRTSGDERDCIYRYDNEKGTVVTYRQERAYAYYTLELGALLFNESGFMVRGGETLYYYEVGEDGNVILYHQDATAEGANRYGFVAESGFGKFEDEITFDGETYYLNDAAGIVFGRSEADAQKYPIQLGEDEDGNPVMATLANLTFAPTGAEEFTVRGSLDLLYYEKDETGELKPQTQQLNNCYIIRELDENNKPKLTVNYGNLYWDIEVNFTGGKTKSSYTVTGSRSENTFEPSIYLYNRLMYLLYYGQDINNTFGYISLVSTYGEDGMFTGRYLTAEFGANSGVTDVTGKPVVIEMADYEFDETTGLYTVEYHDENENLYRLRFQISTQFAQFFGSYSFDLIAFTKVDTLTEGDYSVEIERVIASDGYARGTVLILTLMKGGEAVETTSSYYYDHVGYFIAGEQEGTEKQELTYYLVRFTEDETVESGLLPALKSMTLETKQVTRYFGSSEYVFADIAEDGVVMFALEGRNSSGRRASVLYIVEECTYDEATSTYTVTAHTGTKYTVKIGEDDTVTVEAIPEPEEGEEQAGE